MKEIVLTMFLNKAGIFYIMHRTRETSIDKNFTQP